MLGMKPIRVRGRSVGVIVKSDTKSSVPEEKGSLLVEVQLLNPKSTLVRSVRLDTANV